MTPGDIITFSKVTLRDGREVKAMVEQPAAEPISRCVAMQMILAASLLMEETLSVVMDAGHYRLARRIELLWRRMEDAIAREGR